MYSHKPWNKGLYTYIYIYTLPSLKQLKAPKDAGNPNSGIWENLHRWIPIFFGAKKGGSPEPTIVISGEISPFLSMAFKING